MEAGSGEGSMKPKRQMKTPFQLETLETTYALETYPSEAIRVELAEKLGLTDRQLQMWFCHRRLKDKKDAAAMKERADGAVVAKGLLDSTGDEDMVAEQDSDQGSGSRLRPGSGSGSRLGSGSETGSGSGSGSGSSQFHYGDDVPMMRSYYDSSPQWAMKRVIACVEAQLGEPLREDGPAIGMEFDEPPPGAFGAPIVIAKQQDQYRHSYKRKLHQQCDAEPFKASKRAAHGRPFLPDEPGFRSDAYGQHVPSQFYDSCVDVPSASASPFMHENKLICRGHFSSPLRDYVGSQIDGPVSAHPVLGPQDIIISSDMQIPKREAVFRMESKCKSVEAGTERGIEACQKNNQKELEKQDILRRKREEQTRREMEKQDRERRKEEERMMREKQRKEEKLLREERREIERREKFLQKESLRAERRKQKEELRREKEAARHKATVEKATARKIVKESLELIEDERLELMELATKSKGLPSLISLDHDTLQNLVFFKDSLCTFPPKSVQLKSPFAIQPWIDSEESVGNLLMAWRFCINFADVLELWPFTIDEFIQAFHDYESRLLGEIHIALLKLIIKDIEHVARTSSTGLGTNQYTASNPEGGHPQIVEGAYIWGFDICSWRNHLNPLTWPEIFRQFALSAGFGPQLKKKSIEQAHVHDNNEDKDCEDIVSTLRNGVAAENAVAVIQEKGFSLQCKSRHRLAPGTVKFAAYNVLCLEGSKGLTVLELADKIQKSGLRDLSTSKTPEASISVALSRDVILFERTAPSTYRVRAAFLKDSADAEAILSAAREKIRRYKNGFLAGENGEGVERDEDSECDVAEGPEVDDLGTPSDANKDCAGGEDRKEDFCNNATQDLRNDLDSAGIDTINPDQGDTEIDESKSGEAWVQGLAEGEYSDLCVEERLSALVALVGIANKGNSIRAILEDRLDAANALRKQMWAEAQLDKRRVKEQILTKFQHSVTGIEAERKPNCSAAEGSRSRLPVVDIKTIVKEEPFLGADNVLNDASINQAQQNGYSAERSRAQLKSYIGHRAEELYVYRSLPLGQDRRRNRYWQFVASGSQHDPGSGRIFVESPDSNWTLIDCEEAFDALLMSLDTRGIRESHLHLMLQKIQMSFKDNVRRNLQCANIMDRNRNTIGNEAAEIVSSPSSMLCGSFSNTLELSSSFRIELGRSEDEKKGALRRLEDFQTWVCQECFSSSTLRAMRYGGKRCTTPLGICNLCLNCYDSEDNRCPSCYKKFGNFDDTLKLSEHLTQSEETRKVGSNILDSSHPPRVRLLRALLTYVEVSIPSEALQSSWMEHFRKPQGIKLQTSSSIEDFLQVLTQLEVVIKRDWLSSNFETTEELLGPSPLYGGALFDSAVPQLPWIPQTTAAVALRLFELDASISYVQDQKVEAHSNVETEDFIKSPSGYAFKKNIQEAKRRRPNEDDEHMKEANWVDPGFLGSGFGCIRVVRGKGNGRARGRRPKRVFGSLSDSRRQNVGDNRTLKQVFRQKGQHRHGQRSGWGRRTLRTKRKEKRVVEKIQPRQCHQFGDMGSPNDGGDSLGYSEDELGDEEIGNSLIRDESGGEEEIGNLHIRDGDNSNSDEEIESDDQAHGIGYEYQRRDFGFDAASNGRQGDLVETSYEDVDGSEDENGYEEGEDVNLQEDVDLNYCPDGNEDQSDGNEDEGSDDAPSDDYSD